MNETYRAAKEILEGRQAELLELFEKMAAENGSEEIEVEVAR